MPKPPVILIFLVLFGSVTAQTAVQSGSGEESTTQQLTGSSISSVHKAISFFADLAEAYKKAVIDPVQSIRLKRQKREFGEKLKTFSADLRAIRDLKEDLHQKIKKDKVKPTQQDWQKVLDALAAAKAELKALPPYYPDGFEQKGGELSDAWFEGIVTKTGLFNEVQSDAEAGMFESAANKLVAGENLQTQLAQCVDLFRDQVVNGGKQDVASACRDLRDGKTPPTK